MLYCVHFQGLCKWRSKQKFRRSVTEFATSSIILCIPSQASVLIVKRSFLSPNNNMALKHVAYTRPIKDS